MTKLLLPKKMLKKTRLLKLSFSISGFMMVLFALVSYYGQNAGNFVMSVEYDAFQRGIVLSDEITFAVAQPQLMTQPISEARDITYSWIKLTDVSQTNGSYIDPEFDYIAYTFYIKNEGNQVVDVIYSIKLTDIQNNLDESIRVLVIEDGIETIFQKPDQPDALGNYPTYPSTLPETKYFLSDTIVTRKKISNFLPNEIKKYSVVVWLEGHDPDTTDAIIGGMAKLQMVFAIDDES